MRFGLRYLAVRLCSVGRVVGSLVQVRTFCTLPQGFFGSQKMFVRGVWVCWCVSVSAPGTKTNSHVRRRYTQSPNSSLVWARTPHSLRGMAKRGSRPRPKPNRPPGYWKKWRQVLDRGVVRIAADTNIGPEERSLRRLILLSKPVFKSKALVSRDGIPPCGLTTY